MSTQARDDEDDRRDPEREREPGVPPHQPAAGDGGDAVEEATEESFPSSDPPATGGPGI